MMRTNAIWEAKLAQTYYVPNLFEPHSEQNLDVSLRYGAPHSSQNFAGDVGCIISNMIQFSKRKSSLRKCETTRIIKINKLVQESQHYNFIKIFKLLAWSCAILITKHDKADQVKR